MALVGRLAMLSQTLTASVALSNDEEHDEHVAHTEMLSFVEENFLQPEDGATWTMRRIITHVFRKLTIQKCHGHNGLPHRNVRQI